jgi:hypothetical protein
MDFIPLTHSPLHQADKNPIIVISLPAEIIKNLLSI